MPTEYDALIVGGGQSGLAAAHQLSRSGLSSAILEAGTEPVGSWPNSNGSAAHRRTPCAASAVMRTGWCGNWRTHSPNGHSTRG
ncbi:FAD-dependent oxidoreductase [Nocardia sp. CC227C]|uniref:FAD-dependent oxidoreductase n=1 Tax=Nocardia sp. CC227C TaxID=3044562 RepID=UPI0035581144